MKKKIMQYEIKGHFFDFIIDKPRIIRIVKMAIIVVGGLIRLCDTRISCVMHNLSGMGYNNKVI